MNNDKIISNSATGGNGATQGDQGAGEATAARCAGEAAARRAWKAATGQAWKPGEGGDVQTDLPFGEFICAFWRYIFIQNRLKLKRTCIWLFFGPKVWKKILVSC